MAADPSFNGVNGKTPEYTNTIAGSTNAAVDAMLSADTADAKGGASECTLGGSPTFLEDRNYRFLIIDSPNDKNLPAYIEVLKKKHVVALCRACEPRYSTELLTSAGIKVLDVPFPDGDPPPKQTLEPWLDLVDATFAHNTPGRPKDELVTIAVHCVAGLGRAPALVACALVEHGMEPMDAIAFIRKKRRGAINARQIKWLETYERTRNRGCCVIA